MSGSVRGTMAEWQCTTKKIARKKKKKGSRKVDKKREEDRAHSKKTTATPLNQGTNVNINQKQAPEREKFLR